MTKDTNKWGTDTAKERYGTGKTFSPPPEQSKPQMPEDKQGPGYENDTPETWVSGANEDATTKPGFDRSKK